MKHDEIDGQLHCELQKAPSITNSLKEAAGPSTQSQWTLENVAVVLSVSFTLTLSKMTQKCK